MGASRSVLAGFTVQSGVWVYFEEIICYSLYWHTRIGSFKRDLSTNTDVGWMLDSPYLESTANVYVSSYKYLFISCFVSCASKQYVF